MRRIVISVVTPVLCFCSALAFAGNPPGAIPSYQEALRAYQAERARADGPPVSAEDRLVTAAAARDLTAAMPDPGLHVGDEAPIKAYRLYFEVPSDLRDVYQRLLSLDLAEYNGGGRYVLPVPATFVIGRDWLVRAAYADVDYRMRMEPAAIVAALKAVNTD